MATWLATQGFLVATFDYAGTGQSLPGSMREVDVSIVEWAQVDCDAMINSLSDELPGQPLYWIGHSLGGQIVGLVPDHARIAKLITIAAGSGYWLENVPALKWKVWWLWFFVAPLALRLVGYFPGTRLGMVGDLPPGVMRQWRRWCLDRDYVVGAEGPAVRERFASVRMPITSLSFVDDEMMSARNIESLHGFYENAPRFMKRLSPADIGAKRIGHFGFFKQGFEQALWHTHLLPERS